MNYLEFERQVDALVQQMQYEQAIAQLAQMQEAFPDHSYPEDIVDRPAEILGIPLKNKPPYS
ncbi:MAG TPA: hypothetical protein VJ965_12160 [Anaerolineales bacterium]|nr:hypothetical protein [Anaerolineales bacterium]